jgi:hypothetical protein
MSKGEILKEFRRGWGHDEYLEVFIAQMYDRIEAVTRKQMIEEWNKAMEILYCEHCGKLMSQDLVDKSKYGIQKT